MTEETRTKPNFGILALVIVIVTILGFFGWNWYVNNNYTQAYDDNFTTSCLSSGGAPQGCSCLLSYIKHNFSFEETKRLENDIRDGYMPDAYSRAIAQCS